MITNFSIYENKDYKYLNDEDTEILKEYVTPIIEKIINDKINILTVDDYEKWSFSYAYMIEDWFDEKFWSPMYKFAQENLSESKTPNVHNSFVNILEDYCRENKIYMRMANKLIDIFEDDPKLYSDNYNIYEEYLSAYVKDKLEYIISGKKYNL